MELPQFKYSINTYNLNIFVEDVGRYILLAMKKGIFVIAVRFTAFKRLNIYAINISMQLRFWKGNSMILKGSKISRI